MASTEPPQPDEAAPREATRWGDREQRRRDILDAARTRIEEHGYLTLNMRDLAADAGISPATLYAYFATKSELFITLYTEAARQHIDEVREVVAREPDLVTLLEDLTRLYVDLYGRYGRYFSLWTSTRSDPDVVEQARQRSPQVSVEVATALAEVGRESNRVTLAGIADAAGRDGRRLLPHPQLPALLWSSLTGVADHITSQRRAVQLESGDALIRLAAERLVHTVTDPA